MLHRLPSKNVVATSVLSKRWRSLWKEVNRFSYDGGTVGREYWRFALFISKLSNLESLDLKISPYRTNKFINYLVNIEKAQSRHGDYVLITLVGSLGLKYQPSYVRLACRPRIDVVLSAPRRECYALP
uniref:F-box domain-containing protein n=1 Tax=Brassica campestris TaxID=3711 RepID=M4DCP3_BRACM